MNRAAIVKHVKRSFLVTSPFKFSTSIHKWPSPRFSSSLNRANGVRLLTARTKHTRLWRNTLALAALASLGAGLALVLTPPSSGSHEEWPEDAREYLRAGVAAKAAGDLGASSRHFLRAWAVMEAIPREKITVNLLMKVTSLALTLGDVLEDEDLSRAYNIYNAAISLFPLHTLPPCSSAYETIWASTSNWWLQTHDDLSGVEPVAASVTFILDFVDQDQALTTTGPHDGDRTPIPWGNEQMLRAIALTTRLAMLAEQNSLDGPDAQMWHSLSTRLAFLLWECDTSSRTSSSHTHKALSAKGMEHNLPLPDWVKVDPLHNPILSYSRFLRKSGQGNLIRNAGVLASMAQVMLCKTEEWPIMEICTMAEIFNVIFDAMFRVSPEQGQDIAQAFASTQLAIAMCESCILNGHRDSVCDREYPTALLNHAEVLEYQGDTDKAIYFYGHARTNAEKVGLRGVYPKVDEALRRLEKPIEPATKIKYYRAL